MEALRKSPIGRDFALVSSRLHTEGFGSEADRLVQMTAAGVEFKIHSLMVIGGSKMLEDGLFPGG